MIFEYGAEINVLYVRFRRGKVAETVQIEHMIVIDLDADGQPLGIEFVNAATSCRSCGGTPVRSPCRTIWSR